MKITYKGRAGQVRVRRPKTEYVIIRHSLRNRENAGLQTVGILNATELASAEFCDRFSRVRAGAWRAVRKRMVSNRRGGASWLMQPCTCVLE